MKSIDQIRRDNLALLRTQFGSLRALSAKLERDESQVSQWMQGALNSGTGKPRGMRSETARYIETCAGKPAGWMDTAHDSSATGSQTSPAQFVLEGNPGYPAVRRVEIKASPEGKGFTLSDAKDDTPLVFRADWYEKRGFSPESLLAIRVRGVSMEPTLFEDDLIAVNTESTELQDGLLYVVAYEGEVLIRRLVRDVGSWWLACDNPNQLRYPKKAYDQPQTKVVGQVVYRQTERVD